ncbi:hypothetical protein D3C79_245320 [compost metagenome]
MQRGVYRVHTLQAYVAQNKRHHRGGQVVTAGQPASGDDAVVVHLRQHPCQQGVADGIYRTGPQLFLQRTRRFQVAATRQNLFGAQRFQVVDVAFAAADRGDVIAQGRQNGDCRAANAAAGAGHQNVAVIRMYAAFLQRHHA